MQPVLTHYAIHWSGIYTRWHRWTARGLWDLLLSAVARDARGMTRCVDSTHIKLHQDGANPGGGQAAQAMGRSKGLNTKLVAPVDSHGASGRPWSASRSSH